MKNLFIPVFIIALLIAFGCKNPFQEKSIVGRWKLVKINEKDKWEDAGKLEVEVEFHANGDITFMSLNNKANSTNEKATYTVDNSANPNRVVITGNKNKPSIWIYKFEGEKIIGKNALKENKGVANHFNPEPDYLMVELEKK